jgi:hypothetical protein
MTQRGCLALGAMAVLWVGCAGIEPLAPRDGGSVDGGGAADGGAREDGGVLPDGGASTDGGVITDAGSPDGGSAADGGADDGGGSLGDGGAMDGGAADGGAAPDGGGTDAGLASDAGAAADGGGAADAGTAPDAGTVADAGMPSDGGGLGSGCASTRDCLDGGVCGGLQGSGSSVNAFCIAPRASPPAKTVGSTCTSDTECREDNCLSTLTGECSVICADTALDCPLDHLCTPYRVDDTEIRFCSRTCADDQDCGAGNPGNVCALNGNGGAVDRVCVLPFGAGELGVACAAPGDCRSGLCLTSTLFTSTGCTNDLGCAPGEVCRCTTGAATCADSDKRCATIDERCTALCDDPSDCAAGVPGHPFTGCNPVNVLPPSGAGAVPVTMCTPP